MRYALSVLLLSLCAALPAAGVKGEKQYAAHEPIVLTATEVSSKSAQFLWDIDGAAKTRESGATLYVWAPPGKYTVRLTAIDFDAKKVERATFTFSVGDTPPGPGPGPGPGPKPPTPPPDGKYGLTKASREGVALVSSPGKAAEAKRLAAAIRPHAAAVAAGAFDGTAKILEGYGAAARGALAESERAAWKPWSAAVAARMKELDTGGTLAGNNEWAAAFAEVADGLDPPAGKKGG
jgi:hypothetical protein